MENYKEQLLSSLKEKYAHEKEYLQAAEKIIDTLAPLVENDPALRKAKVLERFLEPERIISFRVSWVDDKGEVQVNRGYRVQFNNAIGPYKGGLRFHPSVNQSILKFLGLEQVLKNSLTGLPLGGAKGGSDFDPKGKSDGEIMRFCQSFMNELIKYIGEFTDVPAGDIGVGGREIGYMYGQYKKLALRNDGVLTGKGLSFGGSLTRTEATGYGLCYLAERALSVLANESFKGKKVVISGSGNVAIYAAEKATALGGKVIALSDSNGYIEDDNGIDLKLVKEIKEVRRGRIKEYLDVHPEAKFGPACRDIWKIKCDIALPCATQNEIDGESAECLVKNGVIGVFEGANMPCDLDAQEVFTKAKTIYAPGKAANAGGVAVSGLEMCQNAGRISWSFEEVDAKLKDIMVGIFDSINKTADEYGRHGDLVFGANAAGFKKVSAAMLAQGIV